MIQEPTGLLCTLISRTFAVKTRGTVITDFKQAITNATLDESNGIAIRHAEVEYFPKGFENFMPNLTVFILKDCGLKEITQADLKVFPKLTDLYLMGNLIQTLENGLFAFNPDLTDILLNGNAILTIGLDVFDSLRNLKVIWLQFNRCINDYAGTGDNVTEFIETVKVSCGEFRKSRREEEKREEKTFTMSRKMWILFGFAAVSVLIILLHFLYRCWLKMVLR